MATKKGVGALLSTIALICVICLNEISKTTGELSCIDENGKQVDWFMGYKFPELSEELFDTGLAYAYISSDSVEMFDSVNNDMQFERKVEDTDSLIFLRRFKDLLVKFGSHFTLDSNKVKNNKRPRMTRNRSDREKELKDAKWIVSKQLITDPKSSVMRTLEPAYASGSFQTISSIFYNDDPEKTGAFGTNDTQKISISNSFAHAKGVLLMEEESDTGVWFTHSVPKFPPTRSRALTYPDSGKPYGQTFMCITFKLSESGEKLIHHLGNMQPAVYDRHLTQSIIDRFPGLDDLKMYDNMLGKRSASLPNLAQTIKTKGGQLMKLYSKPRTSKEDIYNGWIDQDIGSDLLVETWRKGSGGKLNSSCPKNTYHVNNVQDLKYTNDQKGITNWAYTKDHSKWAITDEPGLATACICDANRVESQFVRGSGCVCINCPTCWNVFRNTVADTEPCPVASNKKSRELKKLSKSTVKKIEEYLDTIDFVDL